VRENEISLRQWSGGSAHLREDMSFVGSNVSFHIV